MKYNRLKVVFITLLISIITNTYAGENLRLGIVATPQITWLTSDSKDLTNEGIRAGFNFGVLADSYFAKNYAFTYGLLINHLSGKLSDRSSNEIDRYNLSYIDIPLGIKLKTNEFRRHTFVARFGLNPMINIKAEDDNNTNTPEDIKLFNMAYHIGGGMEYSLGGNTALSAGIIYKTGFTDITKNTSSSSDKTTLHSISLQLGIIF